MSLRHLLAASATLASLAAVPSVAHAAEAPACSLESSVGLTADDASAVEDVVCAEALARKAPGVSFRVRITKLGGQYVLRIVTDRGTDRKLVLSGLEEVPVAAPRVVDAVLDERTVAETRDVDNVVGGETRAPKKQPAHVSALFGITGAGSLAANPTAGIYFGIAAGNARWSFITDLRLTGDALMGPLGLPLAIATLGLVSPKKLDAPSSLGSLSAGVRHHLSAGETAPFLGGGIGLDHLAIRTGGGEGGSHPKNPGLGAHVEAGVDLLRTSTVGGSFLFRVDAPMFTLDAVTEKQADGFRHSTRQWLPFASVVFSMRFQ